MSGLQDWLRPWAEYLVQLAGSPVTVTSTYRTPTQQLRLWLTRRLNPYPVAPPGQSYHEYGRAFDLKADTRELYRLGRIWQSWGGTWSPSDPIHFQA